MRHPYVQAVRVHVIARMLYVRVSIILFDALMLDVQTVIDTSGGYVIPASDICSTATFT